MISGNFLIDSESQMKAAASGMGGMADMPGMQNEPIHKPKGQAEPSGEKAMEDMPGMGAKKP